MNSNNRRTPRLFVDTKLMAGRVSLADHHAHYLRRVLRLKPGDSVVLFNGVGDERQTIIENLARNHAALQIVGALEPLPESPLEVSLIQSLVKAEAMDLIMQKATELGVRTIVPVLTDFSIIKLNRERAAQRTVHWQKITRSACEQSGRHCPPIINQPQPLTAALANIPEQQAKFTLHPGSTKPLRTVSISVEPPVRVAILIGPEGGLSAKDLQQADQAGFERITLGPRTLRTETAALAACALAQNRWGDLSA